MGFHLGSEIGRADGEQVGRGVRVLLAERSAQYPGRREGEQKSTCG